MDGIPNLSTICHYGLDFPTCYQYCPTAGTPFSVRDILSWSQQQQNLQPEVLRGYGLLPSSTAQQHVLSVESQVAEDSLKQCEDCKSAVIRSDTNSEIKPPPSFATCKSSKTEHSSNLNNYIYITDSDNSSYLFENYEYPNSVGYFAPIISTSRDFSYENIPSIYHSSNNSLNVPNYHYGFPQAQNIMGQSYTTVLNSENNRDNVNYPSELFPLSCSGLSMKSCNSETPALNPIVQPRDAVLQIEHKSTAKGL